MKCRVRVAAGLLALFVGASAGPACAQQPCEPPSALPQASGANIFSVQQEMDLGDAIAEQFQRNFKVIDDDEVTGYLSAVANRMVAQLPGEHPRLRVFVIDLPVLNAFSLPGGRIYVSREMVAFLRSDDEMAGLLGHEMGHILSRQFGVQMTQWFQTVLGVSQVGDRKDIFDKYNQFLDNSARHPEVFRKGNENEEPNQYQADRIALLAMASAGYSPRAFVDFYDRLAGTHGKTGNWFSDLFGAPPEQKRLRIMHRALDELPTGCTSRLEAPASQAFLDWQSAVAGYTGLNRRDILEGVAAETSLSPPLRTEITQLKYSPDGRYLLAQDDSSIYVLSRHTFQTLFRIPAEDAEPARFSPDSSSVVFYTPAFQVEKWSVAGENQTSRRELFIRLGCLQSALSPDGATLACYEQEDGLTLYDVDSGTSFFTHKFPPNEVNFSTIAPGAWGLLLLPLGRRPLHIRFSPDGRYLVAASRMESVAVDLSTRQPVRLHGPLAHGLHGPFDFLGPDRIIRINMENTKDSDVLRFPSGDKLSAIALGGTRLDAATHGDTIVVGPIRTAPAALLDVDTRKALVALKKFTAVDVYDRAYIHEEYDGTIGEYELATGKLQRTTPLPPSLLGRMRAVAASPDLRWLALSGRTRGAVWDLSTGGRRFYVRGFRGGYFDSDRAFFAEYPKLDQQERAVARAALDGSQITAVSPVGELDSTNFAGSLWLTWKAPGINKGNFKKPGLEARNITDGKLLWTREFSHGAPWVFASGSPASLIFEWPMSSDTAREAAKNQAALRSALDAIDKPENSYVLEVVDLATGGSRGFIPVDTGKGSFRLRSAYAAGNFVVTADSLNRLHIYSLATGEQLGRFFGSKSTLSERTHLLCVENEPGRLSLYDLSSLAKKESYTFGYPAAFAQFSGDGRRLLVVTQNQKAYVLDVSKFAAAR
jgi:WD40 repeat protein